MNQYFVYILTNYTHSVLYIGVTNDLERRLREHREGISESFSRKYNLTIVVYIEPFTSIDDAIAAEKKVKGWTRKKKEALIEIRNPEWKDLSR